MTFLDGYLANRKLVRVLVQQSREDRDEATDAAVLDAINFFDRNGDIAGLRDLYKKRFSTSVQRVKAADGTETNIETYTNEETAESIDNGAYEIVSTGFGTQIAKTIASLTTQASQRYTYTLGQDDEGKDKPAEEYEAIIAGIRQVGGYAETMETADFLASAVDCCFLHVYWLGGQLRYDAVAPHNIHFIWPEKIIETAMGRTIERAIDKTEIDDAGAIVIHIGESGDTDNGTEQWQAYIGASEQYPDGRMVSFAANDWNSIPEVGAQNIIAEYRHNDSGKPCNPLTYLRNHGQNNADLARAEYPISVLRGGLRYKTSDIKATTTSLYESCLEIELAWSRLLTHALSSARGKNIFEFDPGADRSELPRSLDNIVLPEGAHFSLQGIPASNSKDASEVIKVVQTGIAGGFSVPGYMVVKGTAAPESGYAIAIQTQPFIEFRQRRVRINEQNIARIFDIERAMLAEVNGKPIIPLEVEQDWNPGRWIPPRDEKAETEEIILALDNQLADLVESVRRKYQLGTDQEAIDLIEKFKARDPEYGKEAGGQAGFGGFGATPPPAVPDLEDKDEDEPEEDEED